MTSVKLIANTAIDDEKMLEVGYADTWAHAADELAEFAGRNCYRSFHRPNPATAENDSYLAHILDVGHESVLEHASATFYIEASRSALTELERHRHLSFSVVSQRYVDPVPLGYHIPPLLEHGHMPEPTRARLLLRLQQVHQSTADVYDEIVDALEANSVPRKQAREAARAVLPNMTSSPMVVTGNLRAWRYVIKARWHEAADAEIRELAGLLLAELRMIAPNTFQDIPSEPYTY